MIIGVTHDSDGRVVQRLSVSTKLAIGLPPNDDRKYPIKLDHFVFLRKKKTAKGIEWEPDPELTEHYGQNCRAVRIVLLDDDIENSFPTSYAWWTALERRCWGDGTSAIRRTAEQPGGRPWTPCGKGCAELASRLCKPSGNLYFVLADFPSLGRVCRIHTSSYCSIRQIHSALKEIQDFTGGRLAALTAKLVVRPESMPYFDLKEKKKKSTTIWALSLEVDGPDMRKLVTNLTENVRLFAETRKLLGEGRLIDIREDEAEQASELAAEFYNASGAGPSSDEECSVPDRRGGEKPAATASVQNTPLTEPPGAKIERAASAKASSNDRPAREPAPWETERTSSPANGQRTVPAQAVEGKAQPAGVGTGNNNGSGNGSGAPAKTTTVRGLIGPLEPDESGNTVRRNREGVEYVVFKITRPDSAATVYCNRPELLPEIARRRGREATAQISVIGKNGHTYNVLEGFVE